LRAIGSGRGVDFFLLGAITGSRGLLGLDFPPFDWG
jgi:hypothetical protein